MGHVHELTEFVVGVLVIALCRGRHGSVNPVGPRDNARRLFCRGIPSSLALDIYSSAFLYTSGVGFPFPTALRRIQFHCRSCALISGERTGKSRIRPCRPEMVGLRIGVVVGRIHHLAPPFIIPQRCCREESSRRHYVEHAGIPQPEEQPHRP